MLTGYCPPHNPPKITINNTDIPKVKEMDMFPKKNLSEDLPCLKTKWN